MSFNDGRLFVADVGQGRREEVDIVQKGENYGWNVKEGSLCFNTDGDPLTACPDRTPSEVRGGERLVDPVIEYPHMHNGESVGISAIGGYIYGNDAIPALRGKYVFGDYSQGGGPNGSVFAATPDGEGEWSLEELVIEGSANGRLNAYVIAFGRDNAGDLYVLTTGGTVGGTVHRIVPPSGNVGTASATETGTKSTTTPTNGSVTESTATVPETADNTATTTGDDGTTRSEPDRGGTPKTVTPTSGGSETETTGTSGPGLGALAALGGVASVAAYLLSGSE